MWVTDLLARHLKLKGGRGPFHDAGWIHPAEDQSDTDRQIIINGKGFCVAVLSRGQIEHIVSPYMRFMVHRLCKDHK